MWYIVKKYHEENGKITTQPMREKTKEGNQRNNDNYENKMSAVVLWPREPNQTMNQDILTFTAAIVRHHSI